MQCHPDINSCQYSVPRARARISVGTQSSRLWLRNPAKSCLSWRNTTNDNDNDNDNCICESLTIAGTQSQRLENVEAAAQVFIDGQHRRNIVEFTAVVWGAKDGDELTVSKELVSILHHLVSTNY